MVNYEDLKLKELKALATERGLLCSSSARRDDLVALLVSDDEVRAGADTPEAAVDDELHEETVPDEVEAPEAEPLPEAPRQVIPAAAVHPRLAEIRALMAKIDGVAVRCETPPAGSRAE